MAAAVEELSWFRQLVRRAGNLSIRDMGRAGEGPTLSSWVTQTREWPAFELADAMEQGLACELMDRFTDTPMNGATRKLTVSRSEDKLEYVLLSEEEEPMLIARKVKNAPSIDVFVASSGGVNVALGPAFRLTHDESKCDWELRGNHCSRCEYSPCRERQLHHRDRDGCVLLRSRQQKIKLGPASLMSMEIELPQEDRVWCENCSRIGLQPDLQDAARLVSLKPQWSNRHRSLILDFAGSRVSEASTKNFRLVAHEAPAKLPVLTYGKIEPGVFCIDFRGPLGPAQAFAIALSTFYWQ